MIGCFNSQLSDYNCIECLVKYEAADVPITFEEIEVVMINDVNTILALKKRSTPRLKVL